MGKKELYIQVPSLFRCPISLDVMKSPVSLSTGVTYDRASIQRWLDSGNNTCPATMQLLPSKDFVPNHTLHRLIQIWSHNNHPHAKQLHSLSSDQVLDLISRLSNPRPGPAPAPAPDTRLECYIKILCYASDSPENRKFLASNDAFLTDLVYLLASDGPHLNPDLLEAVLKIFHLLTSAIDDKEKLRKLIFTNPNLIPNLAKILRVSGSDSRVAVARIIEATAFDHESKKHFFDNHDILNNLLDVLNFHRHHDAAEITAALSCLIALTSPRRNKIRLIEAGGVPIITKLISIIDDNHVMMEHLLTLLEMLVGCTAARAAVTDDPNCIAGIIDKIMKVSTTANEHAAALLWSLCYLFRDQKAREAMSKSNGGLTKILLLMQSDCSPAVKKMCCDLLRVFRINSKSCLSNYDTKTTHIMPC